MVHYQPIALLEATLFLANHGSGVSWKTHMEKALGKNGAKRCGKTFLEYSGIMVELERRLAASITVPEETVQKLFAPMYRKGKEKGHPASDYLFHIMLPDLVEAYLNWEPDCFFDRLKQEASQIPARILDFLRANSQSIRHTDEEISINRLFSAINESDLPQDSKLTLTDLALNTEAYIDLAQETLTPVAREFDRCRDLIQPLLEQFQERYCHETGEAMVDRLFHIDRTGVEQVLVYPTVVCSDYAVIDFSAGQTVLLVCVGAMFEYLREIFPLVNNASAQLTQVLTALSNRNRMGIVTRLLDGPAYGRELASFVGLSPVTISQHISVLLGANLITVHNDGTRAYYSLNQEEIDNFIQALKTYFRRE